MNVTVMVHKSILLINQNFYTEWNKTLEVSSNLCQITSKKYSSRLVDIVRICSQMGNSLTSKVHRFWIFKCRYASLFHYKIAKIFSQWRLSIRFYFSSHFLSLFFQHVLCWLVLATMTPLQHCVILVPLHSQQPSYPLQIYQLHRQRWKDNVTLLVMKRWWSNPFYFQPWVWKIKMGSVQETIDLSNDGLPNVISPSPVCLVRLG